MPEARAAPVRHNASDKKKSRALALPGRFYLSLSLECFAAFLIETAASGAPETFLPRLGPYVGAPVLLPAILPLGFRKATGSTPACHLQSLLHCVITIGASSTVDAP